MACFIFLNRVEIINLSKAAVCGNLNIQNPLVLYSLDLNNKCRLKSILSAFMKKHLKTGVVHTPVRLMPV
jgi:hypothetical protein